MATSPASYSPSTISNQRHRLDTIPSEIRAIIYTHVCNPLTIKFDHNDKLNTKSYPWRLSAVSRLFHEEFSSILLGKSTKQPLHLLCMDGRFPDRIRRRIPNHILDGISTIAIYGDLKYDDLKPSLTTFPSLRVLSIQGMIFWRDVGKLQASSGEAGTEIVQKVKNFVLSDAMQLKLEQEMPREGLERDYYVDGTLYDVLEMKRERRGFDVRLECLVYSSDRKSMGDLKIDSWDAETGTFVRMGR